MFKCDDDMVECPYNKSHLMLRKRLQSHLLKCRLHYPDVELMKCPFNATHLVPEPEFTHHVTNCPDRKLITQYKYDAPEHKQEEEVVKHAPVESEENWDDTDVPDYDPTKYAETATILRRPDGPTPSERKEFVKKERKRLGDVDSEEENDNQGDLYLEDVQEVAAVQTLAHNRNGMECNGGSPNQFVKNKLRHGSPRSRSPWSRSSCSNSPRSRSSRSRSPYDHYYRYASSNPEKRRSRTSRSRSPIERPIRALSYNTNRERRQRERSTPTPPPPPLYSAASLRERNSYDLDSDPYYDRSTR